MRSTDPLPRRASRGPPCTRRAFRSSCSRTPPVPSAFVHARHDEVFTTEGMVWAARQVFGVEPDTRSRPATHRSPGEPRSPAGTVCCSSRRLRYSGRCHWRRGGGTRRPESTSAGASGESGREDAEHTVLLIPGALASAIFYDDLLAESRRMADASIRCFATTTARLRSHSGSRWTSASRPTPRQAGALARDLACDAVVGHSNGANLALEMVVAGEFSRPGRLALAQLLT